MKLITVKLPVLNVKAKGTNVILTQNITKRKELPIDPALFSYCPLCLLEMYRCRYTANHIAVFTQIHIHGKHKPEKDKAPPRQTAHDDNRNKRNENKFPLSIFKN